MSMSKLEVGHSVYYVCGNDVLVGTVTEKSTLRLKLAQTLLYRVK